MTETLLPPPVTLHSTCRSSRVCPLRLQSSSGIAAGRAAWRKPSSRCIWQVFPCTVWRTSPKRCREQGLARHHQRAEQESLRPYRGLAQPPLAGQAVSVCLCGRHLPVPQPERIVRNVMILMAIAVNEDGFREVLGAAVGMKEDKASWVTSSSGSADAA